MLLPRNNLNARLVIAEMLHLQGINKQKFKCNIMKGLNLSLTG